MEVVYKRAGFAILLSVLMTGDVFSAPTNTLLSHGRGNGSAGRLGLVPEELQAALLRRTQHGNALALPSVSGVVREASVSEPWRAASFLRAGGPCGACKPQRVLGNKTRCEQLA